MKFLLIKNRRVLLLIGLISCWATTGWAGFPHLKVAEPLHDFGEVMEGEVISHDFTILNTGAEALQITDVRPG